jgi:formate hydrogenlyase subunit 3/multisubunit Na+/H+ antiporter MnhD subunit
MDGLLRYLFQAACLLYVLGAVLSLGLMKWPKIGNRIAHSLGILASVAGIAAAVGKILGGGGVIEIFSWQAAVPFFTLAMNVDQLSAFFLLALFVLVLGVSIYSLGYIFHYADRKNIGLLNFLTLTFILSMTFVLTAANVVFFLIAWEAMALFSYFLVVFEGEKEENQRAGTLYIIMTHVATAFLILGFMLVFSYTHSFALTADAAAIPDFAKNIAFLAFLIGFGTKAGIIPLHIWLPYAHPAAPSNVSALMSGIMIKTAIYGLIRFALCWLGVEHTWWGALILGLGMISAVLGVAYALMEHDIKRLLAFHSVENIGIIFIGLGVSFIAFAGHQPLLAGLAMTAALLHTLNHTLFKGGLFLGAGSVQYAAHTRDIEKLGGLIKGMPVTALLILCFSLAISAILPFNGFISEWLTYQSLFAGMMTGPAAFNVLAILAVAALALTGALAAACFVKLFGIAFLGRPRSGQAFKAREAPLSMNVGQGILAVLCLAIGLMPLAVLRLIDPVVTSIGGTSVFGQLRGGWIMVSYPLSTPAGSVSPLVFLLALLAFVLLSLLSARIIGGKYLARRYGTWDCGFEALNARMQYSAAGFAKPFKIVFRILFRPSRKITLAGDSAYHPEGIAYSTSAISIFEEYLYHPLVNAVKRFSLRTKFLVQTGNIHNYLCYILFMVLLLMLYNRFA